MSNEPVDARIGKLEGIVEALTNDIKAISADVNAVGTQIGDLKDIFSDTINRLRDNFTNQLDVVSTRLSESSKPQWQSITAFVSMAIVLLGMAGAVVGLILSGQSDNIKGTKGEVNEITKRMYEAQYEKGRTDATTTGLELHLKNIDAAMQREMALTSNVVDTKVNGLDAKLQIEFNLIRKNLESMVETNKEDIRDLRAWRLKHAEDDAAIAAKVVAKQDMIEKKLTELDAKQWDSRYDKLKMYEERELYHNQPAAVPAAKP